MQQTNGICTLLRSVKPLARKSEILRKPEWLKIKINTEGSYQDIKHLLRGKSLNTVCEEAKCPNIYECWSERSTATFMILGKRLHKRLPFLRCSNGPTNRTWLGRTRTSSWLCCRDGIKTRCCYIRCPRRFKRWRCGCICWNNSCHPQKIQKQPLKFYLLIWKEIMKAYVH